MSDLNDLIHTNARIAFQQGEQREQERIVKLLNDLASQQRAVIGFNPNRSDNHNREIVISTAYQVVALIKGELK